MTRMQELQYKKYIKLAQREGATMIWLLFNGDVIIKCEGEEPLWGGMIWGYVNNPYKGAGKSIGNLGEITFKDSRESFKRI